MGICHDIPISWSSKMAGTSSISNVPAPHVGRPTSVWCNHFWWGFLPSKLMKGLMKGTLLNLQLVLLDWIYLWIMYLNNLNTVLAFNWLLFWGKGGMPSKEHVFCRWFKVIVKFRGSNGPNMSFLEVLISSLGWDTLTGWWFQTWLLFSIIYGMSSFPLTNSYFSNWLKPPTS